MKTCRLRPQLPLVSGTCAFNLSMCDLSLFLLLPLFLSLLFALLFVLTLYIIFPFVICLKLLLPIYTVTRLVWKYCTAFHQPEFLTTWWLGVGRCCLKSEHPWNLEAYLKLVRFNISWIVHHLWKTSFAILIIIIILYIWNETVSFILCNT